MVKAAARELAWWLGGAGRLLTSAPRRALLWLAGTASAVWFEAWTVVAGLVLVLVPWALWCRLHPVSFERWLAGPLCRRRIRVKLQKAWPQLMEVCGLTRRVLQPAGGMLVQVPPQPSWRWRGGQLIVVPRLLLGQTVEDVQAAGDRLRVAAGARRLRVVPNEANTGCQLRFLFDDPLAAPVPVDLPPVDAPLQLETVVMGRTEEDEQWRLPLRVSTLVAGSTGSGKASAMWMLLLGPAPAIRAGYVQVHGIDLKGGVEHKLGAGLFTRIATSLPEAVILLEDAVVMVQRRLAAMASIVRSLDPTPAVPLLVIVIDELAALTAYTTDKDLLRRADAALRLLLSQGRAPGLVVFGFLQDPRKDTLPMRHLFGQAFGLRLREREEVAMVLSDGAVAAGAECHKIPRHVPGVGYVLDESGRVQRVRCGHVTDQLIRQLAARFPTPRQIPIDTPVIAGGGSNPEPGVVGLAGRSERAPRAPRAPRKPRTPRATGAADIASEEGMPRVGAP